MRIFLAENNSSINVESFGLNCGRMACERLQLGAHIGHFTPLNSVQQAQTLSGYFWKDYIFQTRIRQITLDSQSILN